MEWASRHYAQPWQRPQSGITLQRSVNRPSGVSVYQMPFAPKPRTGRTNLSEWQRVEGVLWIAKEPMGGRKLAELANLEDATRVRTIVAELNRNYDRKGRAFQIRTVAGGYQLLSRPQFAKWIRRLQHVGTPERLSGPALETLAVVAYRQPLVRAEIDAIRGVHSGEVLRQLLEKDLVKIAGRSQDLGHPFLYATTRRFLKIFGLGNLDELPAAGQLRRRKLSDKDTPTSQPDPEGPTNEQELQ
jgi:segregation and condensation protein B